MKSSRPRLQKNSRGRLFSIKHAALQTAAVMYQGLIVPLDAMIALRVARISGDLKLPLADSVILATAQTYSGIIWTQDTHFKGLEGIRYTEKR